MKTRATRADSPLHPNDPRDIAQKVKIIYVRGSTGNLYTLTVTDLVWTCTCKAFQYRPGACKHIKAKGGSLVKKSR